MDDERLEAALSALDWMESQYDEKAEWVPRDAIPDALVAEMKARGKLITEEASYYMSAKGNLTRYPREGFDLG